MDYVNATLEIVTVATTDVLSISQVVEPDENELPIDKFDLTERYSTI